MKPIKVHEHTTLSTACGDGMLIGAFELEVRGSPGFTYRLLS